MNHMEIDTQKEKKKANEFIQGNATEYNTK